MYELIYPLKIAQADTIMLYYKLLNYRWNMIDNDSTRASLLTISNQIFPALDILGEHIRELALPDSPNIDNILGITSIEVDSMVPLSNGDMIQNLIAANSAVLQTLQTAKIIAQGLNASNTVSIIDDRITQHQSLANSIAALTGN